MLKTENGVLCLMLFLSVLAACATPSQLPSNSGEPVTITIGAVLGLSGSVGVYGESQQKGIDLAVKEINSSSYLGKGKELKVIVEDSGATNEGAVAVITRLISEKKVIGIIGPTLSAQAFAADPIAQKNGIPVMGISNTVPKITEMGDFVFRCSLPESEVIKDTIKAAIEISRVKKVGILWQKDEDFTIGSYQVFTAAIKKNSLEILADETFASGETDFKAQLSRIIATYPDSIVVSAFVKEASQIAIQSRSLGFKGTIIGGNGFNSPEITKQAGTAAEGIIVGTAWNMASKASRNVEFISAFQKVYSARPDQFAAQAYTSVWLYANAIRNAGSYQPKAIRDAMAGIRNFDCPLGSFSFTSDREPVHTAAVQIIRGGKFVILETVTK
jgi:branched-chain amino acid transport system substrate-binding protein